MTNHPATQIPADCLTALIVRDGPPPKCLAQGAWIWLKELQRLSDGRSARIEPAQLARMEAMPSHWPTPVVSLAARLEQARPVVTAAVAARRASTAGGA